MNSMASDTVRTLISVYLNDLPPDVIEEIILSNSKKKPACVDNKEYLLQHIKGIIDQLVHSLSVGEFTHHINKHNAKVVNLESAKKLIELQNMLFSEGVKIVAERHILVELLLSKININLEKYELDHVLEVYGRNLSFAAIVFANCISNTKQDSQITVDSLYLFVIVAVTVISVFKVLAVDESNTSNSEVSADLREALYDDYVLLLVNFAIGNSSSMETIPKYLKLLSRKIFETSALLDARHLQHANVRKSLFDNIKKRRMPFLCEMMPDFKKGSLKENVQLVEDSLQDSSFMSLSDNQKSSVSLDIKLISKLFFSNTCTLITTLV